MASISREKHHAHELVERLDPSQLPTAVRFLEFILLDPVSRAIAAAPMDDETLTEAERQAVAQADEWLKHNKPIPFEDVLADFGLTVEDLEKQKKAD